MAGLDDAGMDRTDRDLVKILAFDREKLVSARLDPRLFGFAERLGDTPGAEVQPRPRVRRAGRLEAVKAADRAFEPVRRRVKRRDRGELAVGTFQREHADLAGRLFEQRQMHGGLVAP
jgi:hypothetical protein